MGYTNSNKSFQSIPSGTELFADCIQQVLLVKCILYVNLANKEGRFSELSFGLVTVFCQFTKSYWEALVTNVVLVNSGNMQVSKSMVILSMFNTCLCLFHVCERYPLMFSSTSLDVHQLRTLQDWDRYLHSISNQAELSKVKFQALTIGTWGRLQSRSYPAIQLRPIFRYQNECLNK